MADGMRIFLDFEASSLDDRLSYPIEVGWVDEAGDGEAHLIRPAPAWTDWDASAEATHGISRAVLERDGEPHEAVCERLIALFEGNTVHCSAPSWDGHWLSMLLRASGKPRHLLRMRDTSEVFEAAARERLGAEAPASELEAVIAAARAVAEAGPVAHRALADARREWEIWRTILAG